MTPIITAFRNSPDKGRGLARDRVAVFEASLKD
jgi:hypothetical protein